MKGSPNQGQKGSDSKDKRHGPLGHPDVVQLPSSRQEKKKHQQQQQRKQKTTNHWLVRILKQDEGRPALGQPGVVQVPPDEEARSQQEAQRQQDDQNHAHCNLTSIARKQVCTAQHRPE